MPGNRVFFFRGLNVNLFLLAEIWRLFIKAKTKNKNKNKNKKNKNKNKRKQKKNHRNMINWKSFPRRVNVITATQRRKPMESNKATKQNKIKETLFYGRTDLPSRVGRSGHFFFFFFIIFFFSGGKNDSHKKHKNIPKNLMFFWGKLRKKNLVTFQKFPAKSS